MLSREQQDIDHLPGGLGRSVALGDPRPELVKAVGPLAAGALLAERDGADQRSRLAREQLEVVIQLGAGPEAADEAVMARDLSTAVRDRDLSGADRRDHAQPGERDRD